MASERPSHRDEVRPFALFLLTGGLVTGVTLIGTQHYWLGIWIGIAGCVGALLAALISKMLDRL